MSNPLDFCPTCGRRISDYDENGTEREDGQRWCRDHYLAAREGVATCDVCGKIEHTPEELAACISSAIGPGWCSECNGDGSYAGFERPDGSEVIVSCPVCDGTGRA